MGEQATDIQSEAAGESDVRTQKAVIEAMAHLGGVMTQAFGDWCEVVVHDLADLNHSIVSISGNVTGREVGGNITDLGLAKIHSGETEPMINYTSYTDDGKTLKCSTVFLCDETGKPYACVCINLNITPVLLFQHYLRELGSARHESETTEFFGRDLSQTVENIIARAVQDAGKPLSVMTKDDRLKMVAALESTGLFQLKNSVPLVAKRLGVTRKTIYNYLSELAGEGEEERT